MNRKIKEKVSVIFPCCWCCVLLSKRLFRSQSKCLFDICLSNLSIIVSFVFLSLSQYQGIGSSCSPNPMLQLKSCCVQLISHNTKEMCSHIHQSEVNFFSNAKGCLSLLLLLTFRNLLDELWPRARHKESGRGGICVFIYWLSMSKTQLKYISSGLK